MDMNWQAVLARFIFCAPSVNIRNVLTQSDPLFPHYNSGGGLQTILEETQDFLKPALIIVVGDAWYTRVCKQLGNCSAFHTLCAFS